MRQIRAPPALAVQAMTLSAMQSKQPLAGRVVLRPSNSVSSKMHNQNAEPNSHPNRDFLATHARVRPPRLRNYIGLSTPPNLAPALPFTRVLSYTPPPATVGYVCTVDRLTRG